MHRLHVGKALVAIVVTLTAFAANGQVIFDPEGNRIELIQPAQR